MAYATVTSLMTTLGLLLMQTNYSQNPLHKYAEALNPQIKSLCEKVCSLQALLETLVDMNDVESVSTVKPKSLLQHVMLKIELNQSREKSKGLERCLQKGSRGSLLQASSKSIHSEIKELKEHMNKGLQQAFKSIDSKRKELMRLMKKGVQATRSSNLPEYSPPQLDNNVVGRKIELDVMMSQLTQTSSNEAQVVAIVGIGKTIFARRVYNDPIIEAHFEIQAWEVRCGNVASYAAQGNSPYQMTPLSSTESWELFQDKILVKEQLSPEFIEIGKNIANSFQGLPLTIAVVAGLLSKCNSALDRWKQVEQNVKSTLFEDSHHQCKKILASSYQNLPRHLKACFLYFGVFPEYTEVHVKRLIELWIAEGFLKEAADTSLESVAEGCLHELIDKKMVFISRHNFLQRSENIFGYLDVATIKEPSLCEKRRRGPSFPLIMLSVQMKHTVLEHLRTITGVPSKLSCANEIFASMPNLKKQGIQYDEEHGIKSPSSDLSCLLVAQGLEAVKIKFDESCSERLLRRMLNLPAAESCIVTAQCNLRHHSNVMAFPIEVEDDRYQLYDVFFFSDQILTTVTCNPDVVTNWINGIEYVHRRRLNRLIVGLDIEWRPTFNRYQHNHPVATLQLCVGRRCLIFQLLYCEYIPDSLTEFLLNPCYAFVGVGIANDVEKLEEDYMLRVENTVDLRDLADYNLRNAGLKTLCQVVLGREMEKPRHVTIGRWDNECLDSDQVQYACVDAFVSFEIGRCMNATAY
ncbi:hypothetical protein KY290_006678 [Solanum tuberosum]|uniref:3'-5' exonuclease domain-containing protein n=1 Tax=Solanum tuberosum TaxID=4113 RepID=A0ABQ7WHQ2_SOLTU|nr:hypothetical protein KY284_006082 [Solanum tuberosum]KAH0753384.1 hypothetical protein KY285_006532 [Solanum tuberosum]KAH0780251.1 hypothetical protein KY290_006678 [Solanum tuberosum]